MKLGQTKILSLFERLTDKIDRAPVYANPLTASQRSSSPAASELSRSSPKGIAALDFTTLPFHELAYLANNKDDRRVKDDIVWCVCAEIINACGFSASPTVRTRVLDQLYGRQQHTSQSQPVKALYSEVVTRLQRCRSGLFRYHMINPILKYVGAPEPRPTYRASMTGKEFDTWVAYMLQAIFEAVTGTGGHFVRYIQGWLIVHIVLTQLFC